MYVTSQFTLQACDHNPGSGKIKFPGGVCFPAPYGSTSATSDYDVGLIGKNSGLVVAEFNKRFEDSVTTSPLVVGHFGKPSELVFDTNIYAYSLEYAMPSLFEGLSIFYSNLMPKLDFYPQFQMLELAGAYMKVGVQ